MSLHDLRGLEVDAADMFYFQLPSTGALDILDILESPPPFCCTEAIDDRLGLLWFKLNLSHRGEQSFARRVSPLADASAG